MVISLLPSSAAVCLLRRPATTNGKTPAREASEVRNVSATQPFLLFSAALRDHARLQHQLPVEVPDHQKAQQKLSGSRLHARTEDGTSPCPVTKTIAGASLRQSPAEVQATHTRQLQIQY